MGSSSKPTTTTTIQNNDPWGPVQQPILTGVNEAARLYGQGVGYQPYTGPTQAPLSSQTQNALARTEQIASQPNGLVDGAVGSFRNIFDTGGVSAEQRAALQPFEAAARGDFLTNGNPFIQQIIDRDASRIRNQVNSQFAGAGRYGSGDHAGILSTRLAEASLPVLSQNYENERARQMQGAQGIIDTFSGGQNRLMQAGQIAPTINNLRYADAERLAGIGDFNDARAQEALNSQIALHDQQQARDWEQLARYNAIVGQSGQLGGTRTSTTPVSGPSTAQRAIGGAAAGGALLGPLGALGGGLLGYFG